MLFMLFSAGDDSYAIPAREVDEVVPFARLKSLPCTHPAFAGLFNFRGTPVPVLDLNQLLGGEPVQAVFTTRILLCRGAIQSHPEQLVGFVAEEVVETRHLDESKFTLPTAASVKTPYVGQIFEQPNGQYLQWIHLHRVLTPDVEAELLQGMTEAA